MEARELQQDVISDEITLSDIIQILKRRKWLLISTFAITVALTLIYLFFIATPTYEITATIKIPKSSLKVPTITDLIPGAIFYEQEVHDMLGVIFEGHPDLSPLVVPENWPEGVHPLRKDYSIEKLKEMIKK